MPVGLAALLTPLRHTGPASVQDLGCALLRLVPAAVNEREAAEDLLESGPPPRDLLCDKGFTGRAFAAAQAARIAFGRDSPAANPGRTARSAAARPQRFA